MKEPLIAGLETCHARILEIPQTHSAEKEEYVRSNAASLYPDPVSIKQLEYVIFDSMALIYRPSRCVNGSGGPGYQLLPPVVYALCRSGLHPGYYVISDSRYIEQFHFDGHNISQHSFSLNASPAASDTVAPEGRQFRLELKPTSGGGGMSEESFRIMASDDALSQNRELAADQSENIGKAVEDFYSAHIHNRGFFTRQRKGGLFRFIWAPLAASLAVLILIPLYVQNREMQNELRSARERFTELQRTLQTSGPAASGEQLPQLESLLGEHPPLRVFESLHILVNYGYPNIEIQSISSSGRDIQFTIRGEYPLELQEAMLDDERVKSARISRITGNPDGSRNFVLVLSLSHEGGPP